MNALDKLLSSTSSHWPTLTPKARSELAQLRATVAAQAAIIKEQEQDISNITAREATVVENHCKANTALEAAVNEARYCISQLLDIPNVFTINREDGNFDYCQYCRADSKNMFTIEHDDECPIFKAHTWLATHPAPAPQAEQEQTDERMFDE